MSSFTLFLSWVLYLGHCVKQGFRFPASFGQYAKSKAISFYLPPMPDMFNGKDCDARYTRYTRTMWHKPGRCLKSRWPDQRTAYYVWYPETGHYRIWIRDFTFRKPSRFVQVTYCPITRKQLLERIDDPMSKLRYRCLFSHMRFPMLE